METRIIFSILPGTEGSAYNNRTKIRQDGCLPAGQKSPLAACTSLQGKKSARRFDMFALNLVTASCDPQRLDTWREYRLDVGLDVTLMGRLSM